MGLLLAARPCFGILNASSQTYKLACASETAGMQSDTKQQASTTSAESEDTSQWWGIFRNTTPNQTVGQERGCPVLRWTKKNMIGNPEMKSTQFFLHKINSWFEVVNSSFALLLFTPKNGDLKGISNENVASDFIMALSQIVLHKAMGIHPLDGKRRTNRQPSRWISSIICDSKNIDRKVDDQDQGSNLHVHYIIWVLHWQ